MTLSPNAQQYLKKFFNKEILVKKVIIASCIAIIVFIFSLSFLLWLINLNEGYVINQNSFWYIKIVHNYGIGFGRLQNQGALIYIVQVLTFIFLLCIFLFLVNNKIINCFIACAMFGGLFNLFQRAFCGGINGYVLDYFQFGFWESFPVFNWPDMFVVIGMFGSIISYLIISIISCSNNNDEDKNENR